jgi:hypothetical protein
MSYRDVAVTMNDIVPKKIKKKKKRIIPAGIEVRPWAQFFVNEARYCVGSYSILALVSISAVLLLFLIRWVPGLPPLWQWWRYGAFYYFILYPLYIVNIFLPVSMVNDFYGAAFYINLMALVIVSFLLFIIFYNFFQCWTGAFASSCADNYYIDIVMFVPTALLVYAAILICYNYSIVVGRTSGASRPIAIEYKQI